jgi:hypothetical protein
MRRVYCGIILIAAAAYLSASTAAQLPRKPPSITHPPYTAHYNITQTQKLADGNVIRRESTETVAADAEGRHMTATTAAPPFGGQTLRTIIFVFDVKTHTNIVWTVPGQQARMTVIPDLKAAPNCFGNSADLKMKTAGERSKRPKPVTDDLGRDTIQGIEVSGRRITMTVPSGEFGNQLPIVTTSEMWTATVPTVEGMMVRETVDDPRTGTRTRALTSYEPGDPDPNLFEPPATYEIVKNIPESSCPGTPPPVPQQ